MAAARDSLDVSPERSGGTSFHALTPGEHGVFDLSGLSNTESSGASGAVWALDTPDLNANMVMLRAGDAIGEHVNDDVGVLMIVVSGSGELIVDGEREPIGSDHVAFVPRGASRSVHAVANLMYFSIHVRRT